MWCGEGTHWGICAYGCLPITTSRPTLHIIRTLWNIQKVASNFMSEPAKIDVLCSVQFTTRTTNASADSLQYLGYEVRLSSFYFPVMVFVQVIWSWISELMTPKYFSLFKKVLTGSGGPPCLLFSGYRGSFPEVKRPEREVSHSHSSSTGCKNGWNYTFTLSYIHCVDRECRLK
jgi:hypothetical protein